MPKSQSVLLKLRPSERLGLRHEHTRSNLRPLYDDTPDQSFALGAESAWFVADLDVDQPTAWDHAHARIADQLGIAESDVVFAEPDLVHEIFVDRPEQPVDGFGAAESCEQLPQDEGHNKAVERSGTFAWHLGDDYSQLEAARREVAFDTPRTRIGHIDTGYSRGHDSRPRHVAEELERNFVRDDGRPRNAEEPLDNRRAFPFDSSGHGTGTLSILAGSAIASEGGRVMGGAPDAEVVPIRVADTVVHLRTSALARGINHAIAANCDVVTMSMGGWPTRAWAEAVDDAYEMGICICAAAGNHVGFSPPRTMVYPARYPRVISVAGVMADGRPYADLEGMVIEGSFGPRSAMKTAMAAYTPNVPWAKFGCDDVVDLDGQGTSSATPQVAAAAAIWLEKFKSLPRDWRRVEAVRHALFTTADTSANDALRFGNGFLRAQRALSVRPRLNLPKSERSSNSFAFLRLVTGLGFREPTPRERMFNLEIAQRWLMNERLQDIVPDPEAMADLEPKRLRTFMEAVLEDSAASVALRRHVAARYPVAAKRPTPRTDLSKDVVPETQPAFKDVPEVPLPPYRRIRVFAVDPSLSGQLATAQLNEAVLKVRWEELKKGPIGEYLAVYDYDASGRRHPGVDLDHPRLLAQDGWAPSEGNPQFHQQMVYAVAMKTIEHFERALGRPVLWRPEINPRNEFDDSKPVLQLRIKPHALQQANAFYSLRETALHFGYYEASAAAPGRHLPGSRIYSCLSHDIIAHETTHAILDGMYRRFNEPTNPDVLALHEGFADIVALFQHFTMPEILEREIARTRGDLESESMLGSLAIQFGDAMSGRGALRNAIGEIREDGWHRFAADPLELQKRKTPHARGAVLVAAVFDAFLKIYQARTADLVRLATDGTGVLPDGAIHPDLVKRLAAEASKAAAHVLNICIRALDYLPPVDVTFFEYLRALITADYEMVPDDTYGYRIAFVEAFRNRGIYPQNLGEPSADTPRSLAADTLRWKGFDLSDLDETDRAVVASKYEEIVDGLKRYADDCLYLSSREELFHTTREHRLHLHRKLRSAFAEAPAFARALGLDPERKKFEVHELRRAMFVSPEGRQIPRVIVALTQSRPVDQKGIPKYFFRGGSTLVVDLHVPEVRYRIYKNMTSSSRKQRTEAYLRDGAADPLRAHFLAHDHDEPFAALHALAEDGV